MLAGVAVALRRDGDRVAGLKVALTGTNSAPLRVPTDELVGGRWDAAAAETLSAALKPASTSFFSKLVTVETTESALYVLTLARVLLAIGGPDAASIIQLKASRSRTEIRRQLEELLSSRR